MEMSAEATHESEFEQACLAGGIWAILSLPVRVTPCAVGYGAMQPSQSWGTSKLQRRQSCTMSIRPWAERRTCSHLSSSFAELFQEIPFMTVRSSRKYPHQRWYPLFLEGKTSCAAAFVFSSSVIFRYVLKRPLLTFRHFPALVGQCPFIISVG